MIEISDMDMPIDVAQKIIKGTKPNNSMITKAFARVITGDDNAGETQDMFSIEEIKEIADYLMTYYNNHECGD